MSWSDLLNPKPVKPVSARLVVGAAAEGFVIQQKKTADMRAYLKAYRDRDEFRRVHREKMRKLRAGPYRLKELKKQREKRKLKNAERL